MNGECGAGIAVAWRGMHGMHGGGVKEGGGSVGAARSEALRADSPQAAGHVTREGRPLSADALHPVM